MQSPKNVFQLAVCVGSALFASAAAFGQVALYSNQSAVPTVPALGATTVSASGVAAPIGGFWSETPASSASECSSAAGFSSHSTGLTGAYRFADDFTVTGAAGWSITSVSLYAYQTGSSPLSSPFGGINLRIWSGRPGDAGSVVVFGNTTTNRMVSSTSTNTFRIFNSVVAPAPAAPDTSRLIWRTDASATGAHLAPGTYWLDWQYVSVDPSSEAFSPPVTIAGVRTTAGANARQYKITGGTIPSVWADVIDTGKPTTAPDLAQDFPFIIRGFVGTPCLADFNLDGFANSQDFFDFLSAFFAQSQAADVNHDSLVNSQDFFDFLVAFFAGC